MRSDTVPKTICVTVDAGEQRCGCICRLRKYSQLEPEGNCRNLSRSETVLKLRIRMKSG